MPMPGVPSQYMGEPLGKQYERDKMFTGGGGGTLGVGAQGAYVSGPPGVANLTSDVAELAQAVELAIDQWKTLAHRLDPFCSGPGSASVMGKNAEPNRSRSPVSCAIQEQTARLNILRESIASYCAGFEG